MSYEDKSVYAKYLKASLTSSSSSPCEGCSGSSSIDYCQCCPPGTIELKDADGNRLGCATLPDADEWNTNNRTCKEGYLALYKEGTPNVFIGCVTEDGWLEKHQALNPA